MDGQNWQDIDKDWKFYYEEGESYLKTCKKLAVKKGPFNNEFLYHLAVLAGERLALGLLLSYSHIPAATSLSGMLQEGSGYYTFDKSLLEGTRLINKFQNFCSLDVERLTVPNDEEIIKIVDYIGAIEQFCNQNLNKEVLV